MEDQSQPPNDQTEGETEDATATDAESGDAPKPAKPETGGPKGLEPTRYGDWERNGRCYDF